MASRHTNGTLFQTRILPVPTSELGSFANKESLRTWELPKDESSLTNIREAAEYLKTKSTPVAFPTETVYGLGADATRSEAVLGIYKAKGRPSDNPLIIHICDLTMLRTLLVSPSSPSAEDVDPIPEVYKPLIKRFWPGPLTILLSNPALSKLAPEVTAGLKTFGARMPDSSLALSLIHLAGVPIAAPSANASTKPSCTTAEHVFHDLQGKIEIILDGGACLVGVESTVVDGMCDPPVVLRPGGVSIDDIRKCEGWERVVKAYKDSSEVGASAPRAPGMKYKHYSPKAKVVLYENISGPHIKGRNSWEPFTDQDKIPYLDVDALECRTPTIGVVCTKGWDFGPEATTTAPIRCKVLRTHLIPSALEATSSSFPIKEFKLTGTADRHLANMIQISLGGETKNIAHGLFSALRELDQRGVDIIYVEGIEDEGDIAAAVMNRLRKAASVIEKPDSLLDKQILGEIN